MFSYDFCLYLCLDTIYSQLAPLNSNYSHVMFPIWNISKILKLNNPWKFTGNFPDIYRKFLAPLQPWVSIISPLASFRRLILLTIKDASFTSFATLKRQRLGSITTTLDVFPPLPLWGWPLWSQVQLTPGLRERTETSSDAAIVRTVRHWLVCYRVTATM